MGRRTTKHTCHMATPLTLYSGLLFLSLHLFSVSSGRCRTSGCGLLLPSLLTYLLVPADVGWRRSRASGREREMGSPPVTIPPLTSEQRSRLASGRPCLGLGSKPACQ